MDRKLIAKPPAFALFTASASRFDGRIAFRSAREAPFGPPRRPTAGFRRLRWRAQFTQKRRNYPMDPYGRQPTPIVTALPRQPQVCNTGTRQPQLRVGHHDQPTPPVGLFGMANPRGVVHPIPCLRKRKVCSRSKRLA